MSLTTPTPQQTQDLFQHIESHFPSQTLGSDKWEILAVAATTAGGHPGLAADLYSYLTGSRPQYATAAQRQALVRRLREALLKLVSVSGVPRPLEAVFCISEVEREEDRDYSFSREHWKSGEENYRRGREWLAQIYRHNHAATARTLEAHKDFEWVSMEITYGLYLSDHTILDGVDTEIVVLCGLMMQNMPRETGWHLRGARRIGVSLEDVDAIWKLIVHVADFCGLQLTRVPKVADIEHEVNATT